MTQNEIIVFSATLIVSMIWFFVRGVTSRLDKLEGTLETLVKQVVAASTKQDVNAVEIEKLRTKVHAIEAEVLGVSKVQELCKSCNSRN